MRGSIILGIIESKDRNPIIRTFHSFPKTFHINPFCITRYNFIYTFEFFEIFVMIFWCRTRYTYLMVFRETHRA